MVIININVLFTILILLLFLLLQCLFILYIFYYYFVRYWNVIFFIYLVNVIDQCNTLMYTKLKKYTNIIIIFVTVILHIEIIFIQKFLKKKKKKK